MEIGEPETITIIRLVHDLKQRRSIVTLVWDEPDKGIALPVPYGTSLEDVYDEAKKAAQEFAAKFGAISIRPVA